MFFYSLSFFYGYIILLLFKELKVSETIAILEYRKVAPKYVSGIHPIYLDIEKFFSRAKGLLREYGSILLILEPGDCTRYEFLIANKIESRLVGDLLSGSFGEIGLHGPEISYLTEKWPNANPWTVHLLCEILNQLEDFPAPASYYSFERSLPSCCIRAEDE
jgi:hypothetical protein